MKFKTFLLIACLILIGMVFGTIYLINQIVGGENTSVGYTQRPINPITGQSEFIPPPSLQPKTTALTTEELRMKIEQWLDQYGNRRGKNKLADIMPYEAFRATAIRFPENDAVRWSNNPNQWSQVKLDLNRDGIDDEKWLLKNGHTYKREILDSNGRVMHTEYFK